MTTSTNRLNVKRIESWVRATAAGQPASKKLGDGAGLHLVRSGNARTGSPIWRLKYALAGIERTYSIGPYPEVTLEQARSARDDARALVRDGRDPVGARRLERAEALAARDTTFAKVAEDWLTRHDGEWSPVHRRTQRQQVALHLFPKLGALPVDAITPPMVTAVIEGIVNGNARKPTAKKMLFAARAIFEHARARGALPGGNPTPDPRALIGKPKRVVHHPALLTLPELGAVLVAIDRAMLSPAVRMCHRLVAFTAARISNAVAARWSQFDLDAARPTWTVARTEMKVTGRDAPWLVHLGPTLVRDLREWRALSDASSDSCFPKVGAKAGKAPGVHITREALEKGYRRMFGVDGKHSAHGWRSSFSTICREQGGFDETVVELALDHEKRSEVVRAYDRGARLEQRVKLMRWWDRELTQAEQAAKGGAR